MENSSGPDHLSKESVEEILRLLISGALTREAVSNWAMGWIKMDDAPRASPELWSMVSNLEGADSLVARTEENGEIFLYTNDDFEDWYREIRGIL
ncbi:hypothetical protein SAMN04488095_1486 [Jannaschia pohangensis]|uniref:Uncharacterized protein n=1 Tax=Jannaschia pohangensis TaxID=390807 RepID=A0A1I3K0D7_9RHOB|nr:hypothetical protein SAMN04488095_1486 [Jannaschia pohangensis]